MKKRERCYDKYLRPKKLHQGQLELLIVTVIIIVYFAVELTLPSTRYNCFVSLLSFIPRADRIAFFWFKFDYQLALLPLHNERLSARNLKVILER